MPTDEWERGYSAGYRAAHRSDVRDITSDRGDPAPAKKKKPRKVAAYHREYGRQFRRLESKYKTKSGGWRKGGYRALVKAAHAATRKAMK
jgi:hypothetical protein